jgi:hypothetical protein
MTSRFFTALLLSRLFFLFPALTGPCTFFDPKASSLIGAVLLTSSRNTSENR